MSTEHGAAHLPLLILQDALTGYISTYIHTYILKKLSPKGASVKQRTYARIIYIDRRRPTRGRNPTDRQTDRSF